MCFDQWSRSSKIYSKTVVMVIGYIIITEFILSACISKHYRFIKILVNTDINFIVPIL